MATQAKGNSVSANALALAVAVACTPSATCRAADADGGSIAITNCEDAGEGSLRSALAQALDGDTLDLTGLTCSTITLTSGTLSTSLDDLRLEGPGPESLRIAGNGNSLVLDHRGGGVLAVSGLGFSDGYNRSGFRAEGGCIRSAGNPVLTRVVVTGCHAKATSTGTLVTLSQGGGVFAQGSLALIRSRVTGNSVTAGAPAFYMYARGGGVYSAGPLLVQESTISGNAVYGQGLSQFTEYLSGGGVQGRVGATIEASTINDNFAYVGGGLYLVSGETSIVNSTISGNTATFRTGGIVAGGYVDIRNSTIAFNHASWSGFSGEGPHGAGVLLFHTTSMESTIIANNSAGSVPDDLCHNHGYAVSGSANLIVTSAFPVPPDTIIDDPLLMPLEDNGGPTWTHAISGESPAFGHGGNPVGLEHDQRGPGHPRISGASADIGAYEYQLQDAIFEDGFDPASDDAEARRTNSSA